MAMPPGQPSSSPLFTVTQKTLQRVRKMFLPMMNTPQRAHQARLRHRDFAQGSRLELFSNHPAR